jgi:hypothetical protein
MATPEQKQFPAPGRTDTALSTMSTLSMPDAGTIKVDEQAFASLNFLQYFDTLFLIDDSSNMKQQWGDVTALMQAITPVTLKYDENGIDIYFVNHTPRFYFPGMGFRRSGYNNIGHLRTDTGKRDSAEAIFRAVKPGGSCKLGSRLGKILSWYMDQLKADPQRAPLNVIVITAGIIDDDYQGVLVDVARELDTMHAPEHQLGVQLFQVGDNEKARAAFEHADDALWRQAGVRDIVDTAAWSGWPGNLTADDMVKVVLGSICKRLDDGKAEFTGKPLPHRNTVHDEEQI